MANKVVAVLGTLDSKGAEYAFLKKQIEAQGVATLVLDAGVLGPPAFRPEVPAEDVARAGGVELVALVAEKDRGRSVGVMASGAAAVVTRLHREGRIHGIIAMGGGGGTTIGSTAMRALPVGVPKLMLSTVASGMRTTAEENAALGRTIAAKLSRAKGPTVLMIPTKGVSLIDVEGKPFHDAAADRALFDALRQNLGNNVELVEMDTDINDEAFAVKAAELLLAKLRK